MHMYIDRFFAAFPAAGRFGKVWTDFPIVFFFNFVGSDEVPRCVCCMCGACIFEACWILSHIRGHDLEIPGTVRGSGNHSIFQCSFRQDISYGALPAFPTFIYLHPLGHPEVNPKPAVWVNTFGSPSPGQALGWPWSWATTRPSSACGASAAGRSGAASAWRGSGCAPRKMDGVVRRAEAWRS